MENIESTKKEIVEIDRVVFKEINDKELEVIEKIKSRSVANRFFKKMIISVIVLLVVFCVQAIGNVTKNHSFSYLFKNFDLFFVEIKKYIGWIIALFVFFNVISLFCAVVKRQLVMIADNFYILYDAYVNEKYMGSKLGVEGKERRNYYVVFECDQGVCSKSLVVSKAQYNKLKVGEKVVVLKEVSVEGNTLRVFKDEEFGNIYNSGN
ncbi:MAG: hypothetical protein J6L69_09390 [Lachnospiraceae bacterium]|nr:hypothetical protein [Lachnospiraceae bacterium]